MQILRRAGQFAYAIPHISKQEGSSHHVLDRKYLHTCEWMAADSSSVVSGFQPAPAVGSDGAHDGGTGEAAEGSAQAGGGGAECSGYWEQGPTGWWAWHELRGDRRSDDGEEPGGAGIALPDGFELTGEYLRQASGWGGLQSP